jgi:hypothetical protein
MFNSQYFTFQNDFKNLKIKIYVWKLGYIFF